MSTLENSSLLSNAALFQQLLKTFAKEKKVTKSIAFKEMQISLNAEVTLYFDSAITLELLYKINSGALKLSL